MADCKQCGTHAKVEHRYEVVEYPYNPEWSVTRLDAGVFCTPACLYVYLGEQNEALFAKRLVP